MAEGDSKPAPHDENSYLGTLAAMPKARAIVVVAHPDDDLLFLSNFLRAVHASQADLRVIYLTAGDAGRSRTYWQQREHGVRAAHQTYFAVLPQWTERQPTFAGQQVAESQATSPNHRLSLLFFRLPDGNLKGQGFAKRHKQSLAKLWHERSHALSTVDDQNVFTRQSLLDTLHAAFSDWGDNPNDIPVLATLNCQAPSDRGKDHSDHRYSSLFANQAWARGSEPRASFLHHGYNLVCFQSNLTASQQRQKLNAFLAYSPFDPQVWQGEPTSLKALYRQLISREVYDYLPAVKIDDQANFCSSAK